MRLINSHQSVVLGLAAPGVIHPAPGAGLESRDGQPSPDPFRAWAVRDAFKASWAGYYDHAFPHDSLRPVSGSYEDDRFVSNLTYMCPC